MKGAGRSLAVAVLIAGALATGATAASSAGDRLIPYGPDRVSLPYNHLYAFRVKCAAVPCTIRLNQRFYHGRHPLFRLRDLESEPIVMRQQPPSGDVFATWYTRADFDQRRLQADLAKYGSLTLKLSARMTDALGGTATGDRTVGLELPVLIAGPYHGRRPSIIDISGDAGDIVTGLHWSSWTVSAASGAGTSNIQGCVPDCATGTETPVPTTIRLSDSTDGYFTKLVEQRDGSTEVFIYTPGHLPDNWPDGAS